MQDGVPFSPLKACDLFLPYDTSKVNIVKAN